MSRTPVREALTRLWSEGLVDRHPEGGFRPVVPDVSVMRHLYEVRVGLELQALHRPVQMGTRPRPSTGSSELRDEWTALRRRRRHEPDPDFVLLDESFHVGLAEAAGNPALVELLRKVNERIRIVRMQDFLTEERIVADDRASTSASSTPCSTGDLDSRRGRGSTRHLGESIAVVEERAAAGRGPHDPHREGHPNERRPPIAIASPTGRAAAARGPGHHQALRRRWSPTTTSTSPSAPARCTPCSARTAPARPR